MRIEIRYKSNKTVRSSAGMDAKQISIIDAENLVTCHMSTKKVREENHIIYIYEI